MPAVVLKDTGTHQEQDAEWFKQSNAGASVHFSTSITLLKSGLVFAFDPRNWIIGELAQGPLQRIPVDASMDRFIQIQLILSNHHSCGPVTKTLHGTIIDKIFLQSL